MTKLYPARRPAGLMLAMPLLAAASLSACAADTTRPEAASPALNAPVTPEENQCGAEQLGSYIGKKATDELVASLQTWRGEHRIRVIRPNMPVTMDYRPDRLNIHVDAQGTIEKFTCV